MKLIRAICQEIDGRYDVPKIYQILEKEGHHISFKRVQRLMKKAGIRFEHYEKNRPTSTQKPVEERENFLKQDFLTTTIMKRRSGYRLYPYAP